MVVLDPQDPLSNPCSEMTSLHLFIHYSIVKVFGLDKKDKEAFGMADSDIYLVRETTG